MSPRMAVRILIVSTSFLVLAGCASFRHLKTVRDYAESYDPTPAPGIPVPLLPDPPAQVVRALDALEEKGNTSHHECVILLFLRLDRYYVENCHQGYELRQGGGPFFKIANPLLRHFCRIAGISEKQAEQTESLHSHLPVKWVVDHPEYLRYGLIAQEMKRLAAGWESVARGEPWGESRQTTINGWELVHTSVREGMSKTEVLVALEHDGMSRPSLELAKSSVWRVSRPWYGKKHTALLRFDGDRVSTVIELWGNW